MEIIERIYRLLDEKDKRAYELCENSPSGLPLCQPGKPAPTTRLQNT